MQVFSEPVLVIALLEVALGIVLLAKAADHFVDGAVDVAARAKVSPVLVGAVIVGFGTSAPELLVSGIAAFNGDLELGVGNIIGSNVANLSLVLGAAALIVPLYVSRSILIREAPLMLLSVLAFAWVTIGGLARWEGITLLVLLAAALTWVIVGGMGAGPEADGSTPTEAVEPVAAHQRSGEPSSATTDAPAPDQPSEPDGVGTETGSEAPATMAVAVGRTLVGLVGTVLGAQLLVWGASAIADDLGLTGGFVGFTLVAVGTSLPELVTAVMAARKGETELILGNLLGSNMFNSLAVGGAIAVLGPGLIDDVGLRTIGVGVMVVVAVGAWFAMATLRRVHRVEAVVLLAAWVVAVLLLARESGSIDALGLDRVDHGAPLRY